MAVMATAHALKAGILECGSSAGLVRVFAPGQWNGAKTVSGRMPGLNLARRVAAPRRLRSSTRSPSAMPCRRARSGWISARASGTATFSERTRRVCVVLMRDGQARRYFPIGARGDVHVPLRVVEDLDSGTAVELHLAAPAGVTGTLIVDFGLVEV